MTFGNNEQKQTDNPQIVRFCFFLCKRLAFCIVDFTKENHNKLNKSPNTYYNRSNNNKRTYSAKNKLNNCLLCVSEIEVVNTKSTKEKSKKCRNNLIL